MVNDKQTIKIQLQDGAIKEGQLEIPVEPPWKLIWSGPTPLAQEFSGEDLFEALIAFRLELEKVGARVLCAGARPDVFPSGMSRGMGGGRKAYVTRIGTPSLRNDLIDIFEYAEPGNVGTVAQQKAHYKKWSDFLRQ